MILRRLPPRKPDVIPGSRVIVKQKDRFTVESIMKQRSIALAQAATMQQLPNMGVILSNNNVGGLHVRKFSIADSGKLSKTIF